MGQHLASHFHQLDLENQSVFIPLVILWLGNRKYPISEIRNPWAIFSTPAYINLATIHKMGDGQKHYFIPYAIPRIG